PNVARNISIRDRDADINGTFAEAAAGAVATKRLNVSTSGTQALGPGSATGFTSVHAFMSSETDSGRYVTFYSEAANLVSGDANDKGDIFLRDRDTDNDSLFDEAGAVSTERMSVTDDGLEGNDA